MSVRRRRPGADSAPIERGPDGRALCRFCGAPVPKGRRTFCGDRCVEEWRVRTDPGYARARVMGRDHGICARCGRDTTADQRALEDARRVYLACRGTGDAAKAAEHEACAIYGRYGARWGGWWWAPGTWLRLWEAHHATAVVEGGGECGLDGLVTLCVPCHRRETAALATRRAQGRRRARTGATERSFLAGDAE